MNDDQVIEFVFLATNLCPFGHGVDGERDRCAVNPCRCKEYIYRAQQIRAEREERGFAGSWDIDVPEHPYYYDID